MARPKSPVRRWMTQAEIDRIVAFAGAALLTKEQTTRDLLRQLEDMEEAPPARTVHGRARQLEKALGSSVARERGIVGRRGSFPNGGKGRPAQILWSVDKEAYAQTLAPPRPPQQRHSAAA